MTEVVSSHSRVLADVTVKLKDGSVADSTLASGKPSWLVMGDGSFSDAFESQLFGAQSGQELSFELSAVDAFGETEPDKIHFMDISQFPQDIKLEKGAIVAFNQANGEQLPGIIRDVTGASVKVDFNHPLAGQDIIFELIIKEVVAS